jgi:hypothetical protein
MIQEITARAISWWTPGPMFAVRSAMQPIFLQMILKAVFGLDEGHSQDIGPIFLQMILKAVFGLDEGHSQDIGVTTSDQ